VKRGGGNRNPGETSGQKKAPGKFHCRGRIAWRWLAESSHPLGTSLSVRFLEVPFPFGDGFIFHASEKEYVRQRMNFL
jgi:hypothetical protein